MTKADWRYAAAREERPRMASPREDGKKQGEIPLPVSEEAEP